jgi:aspartyl-tRNA(Asn)/glutamyl-tRNA(Gln) amidotransferase subunit A
MSLHKLTLHELHARFTKGEVTAHDIVRAFHLRINQVEPKIKAYITLTQDAVMAQADALDERLKGWRKTTPLMGMPIAIKDNICTEGVLTTCASRMLAAFVPPYSATVVAKMRQQGALFLGKTNLDEFAMGSSTENSAFGPSRNPWNPACVPG